MVADAGKPRMAEDRTRRYIRVFTLVWLGQLVSAIGTGLTNFSLGVWVYEQTGSAMNLTIVYLCGSLPSVLTLPVAGALADRWGRRKAMVVSNVGAGLSTLPAAMLLQASRLEVWHIAAIVLVRSVFMAFLNPAYTAAVSALIPKQHYGRASGMMQASNAGAQIVPPLLAGLLVVSIGINSVILIDVGTYLFALMALLVVRFPEPKGRSDVGTKKRFLLREALDGWTYIRERPGLLALLFYFTAVNFVMSIAQVLFTPMLLSFTTAKTLGAVLSVSGSGVLIGSIVMSVWGGPRNRVQGVLVFGFLVGFGLSLAGLRPSIPLITAAMFVTFFFVPFINGCSEAIWLTKTPAELQGRVFAIRRTIGFSSIPFAYIVAGVMADKLFEPLLAAGGPLSESVGQVLGVGPGRGIGLLYVVAGVLTLLAPLFAYLDPKLRVVEYELPDAVGSEAPSQA